MAITQPPYPTTTTDLVEHVGEYVDAQDAAHTHTPTDLVPGTPATGKYFDGAAGWTDLPPGTPGPAGPAGPAGAGSTILVSENGGAASTVDQLDLSVGLDFVDTGTGGKMAVNAERVWLHQGIPSLGLLPPTLDNTDVGTVNVGRINAIATAAAARAGGKPAIIGCSEGLIRCTGAGAAATVTFPDLVAFHGPGSAAHEFFWPSDVGAGNYYMATGNMGLTGREGLKDTTLHFTDVSNTASLAPPTGRGDGLFTGRSSKITRVYMRGNARYCCVTNSDHQIWDTCHFKGGWAGLAFLGSHATYGDYYFDDCEFGGHCNFFCESGTQMGGVIRGGHLGFTMNVFMMADGVSNSSIGFRLIGVSIESFGQHVVLDPSAQNPTGLNMVSGSSAGMYDSNAQFRWFFSTTVATDTAATGTYSLPLTDAKDFPSRGSAHINGQIIYWTGKSTNTLTGVTGGSGTLTAGTWIKPIFGDALIRSGAMNDVALAGNAGLLLKTPTKPNGTILRVNGAISGLTLPDLAVVLDLLDAKDKPFGDISGAISGSTATLGPANIRLKRRRNSTATPRKNDALRVAHVAGGEYTSRLANIGDAVAGIVAGGQGAYATASNNNPLLTVISGITAGRVQNVGDTLLSGTQGVPTDGTSTTTTADVTLGPTVRTDCAASFAVGATVNQRVQDPFGLASSGRLSLATKIFSYTGISGDQLTGVVGEAAMGFADADIAFGRVVSVASTAGFSATGGLALLGGQLVTYQGKSGSDIYGITGGTGLVSSGATFAPKAAFKVNSLRNFIAGVNAIQIQGHLLTIAGFMADPVASAGSTPIGYLLSPVLATGDAFASTFATTANIVAGTQINGAHGASPATVTVDSTAGFPSKGKLHVPDGAGALAVATYTDKTATTFTGCTWAPAVGSIADNQPITIGVGLTIAGDKWVRPAMATGQDDADDQGLIVEASSHVDSAGEPFAIAFSANPADNGATVPITVRSRFG